MDFYHLIKTRVRIPVGVKKKKFFLHMYFVTVKVSPGCQVIEIVVGDRVFSRCLGEWETAASRTRQVLCKSYSAEPGWCAFAQIIKIQWPIRPMDFYRLSKLITKDVYKQFAS